MKVKSLKKNAVLNMIKQGCSIVFPFVTFPYISRTLGDTGFGKYNFSFSIVTYFSYIAALGISTYAVREGAKIRDNKKKINQFCSEIYSINIISMIIAYILLMAFLVSNKKVNNYFVYIVILSIAILIDTIGTDWVNSIFEDFTYITIRYIIFQIIALILLFVLVHDKQDVVVYCWISLLAGHGGNLVNLFYIRKRVRIEFIFHMNLKKHIMPLLILFVNSLAVIIYVNADITMLGFYYNDSIVGIYSFASRIYNILKNLINAIVIVSLPRIAYVNLNQKNKIKNYMTKIFSGITYIMLPMVTGMFCMSKQIIRLVGGKGYLNGNESLRVLSVAILFAIYASIFSNCVLIVNKQEKKCLIATIISAIVNIILNLILLPKYGIIAAAMTTLIAEFFNFAIQFGFSQKYYKSNLKNLKEQMACIVGSLYIIVVCSIVNHITYSMLGVIIAILISGIGYLLITIIMKNSIAKNACSIIINKLGLYVQKE